MNWSKTKTIFIICFLLLDLILGYQFYQRQTRSDLDVTEETVESSLQKNKITIETTLPEENQKITFIKGTRINFVDEPDLDLIEPLKDLEGTEDEPIQDIKIGSNPTVIQGHFAKPMAIPDTPTEMHTFLSQYIFHGEEYQLWKRVRVDEKNELLFVQTHDGKPVFSTSQDRKDMLVVFLSLDEKMIGYRQSYMELVKPKSEKLDVISSMDAIEQLLKADNIPVTGNPVITTVELGYFNLIGGTDKGKDLVFVPAWHIVVKSENDLQDFFINGIYGTVKTLDETE